MNEPREFQDFCRRFHQDAFRIAPGLPASIAAALKSFDDRQREVLKDFLFDLVNKDNSGTELKRFWKKNNSNFFLREGAKGATKFFREVLNQLTDK
jgi:hypothetical protein